MNSEIDAKLSELAVFIEDELFEIYGEDMAFVLNVAYFSDSIVEDKNTHYIANIDKEKGVEWLRHTVMSIDEEIHKTVDGNDTLN